MRITAVGRGLLDPRMKTALPSQWTTVCTIQLMHVTFSASNQAVRTLTAGQNIEGLVEIPCRLSALVKDRPTDDIQRGSAVQEYHERRHALLDGYFPEIQPDTMQAVIDGLVYPIRGVEWDGNRLLTRLRLEVVRPNG